MNIADAIELVVKAARPDIYKAGYAKQPKELRDLAMACDILEDLAVNEYGDD